MIADKRIQDISMILNYFNTDKAKEYIGEVGYFTDNLQEYTNLDNVKLAMLSEVTCSSFGYIDTHLDIIKYKEFFLPARYVETLHLEPRKFIDINSDEVKKYIGKLGYFGNSTLDFRSLDSTLLYYSKLKSIHKDKFITQDDWMYSYFIPQEYIND